MIPEELLKHIIMCGNDDYSDTHTAAVEVLGKRDVVSTFCCCCLKKLWQYMT